MHFQHPAILLLLWLLPGVAALLVLAQKRRLAAAQRFIAAPMIARLMPDLRGSRPWTKGVLLVLGLTLLIVAAARPQYGVYYEKVKPQHGVDCFVLLDVSRSMLAEDVAPNRLARAKADIRDLLKKLGGDRVGLIVFAGKPVLKVPLTTDDGFYGMVLDEVDVQSSPRGGTLIGDAIRKALDSMPPQGDHDQILVLLTDGEDQDSYPLDAAKKAAERGVKIFTVGLGDSKEGSRIPVRDASGNLVYVKDEGKEHWSKTDQNVLQEIAKVTDGVHVSAGTRTYDLGQIYEDRLTNLTRGEGDQEVNRMRLYDRYQVFLALALVLLAADFLLPGCSAKLPWRAARRPAMMLVACILGFSTLGASPAQAAFGGAAQKVEEGLDAFKAGDFKTAAEAFGAAAEAMPQEPRIAFDRGCALAAQSKNDEAVEQFQIAAASQNLPLAAAADYNLGCLAIARAKAALGEKPEEAKPEARPKAMGAFEEAVGYLRDCLAIDPEHANARYNLEAIRLWTQQIQEVWRQRDAQKRRQEMSLPQFLQWLEKEQRELRQKGKPLAAEAPSPRRREEIRDVEYAQRDLADEIAPLKEKLHAALAAPAGQPAPGAPAGAAPSPTPAPPTTPGPEAERALKLLDSLADDARTSMNEAADELAAKKLVDAAKPQAAAVEKIDGVSTVVSPFFDLVKKGIATEEPLIGQSKGASQKTQANDKAKTNGKDATGGNAKENAEPDWAEAAWNQQFITNYGRVLGAKAKHELELLAKTPDAAPVKEPADAGKKPTTKKAGENPEQEKAKKQKEEMKRALQAGVDLAPKVVDLSRKAEGRLTAADPAAALPLQEETIKLLREMLPKDEQNKNDQNKDQKDQDKKDQKDKNDQSKKDQDQKKKDQDKKDQDKKKQDKKDQNKQPNQDQKDQAQQPPEKAETPSEREAAAAMEKVRQRQQERREVQKALLEKIRRSERVDKDW
jgi:Ca-activated chloride channel family protein